MSEARVEISREVLSLEEVRDKYNDKSQDKVNDEEEDKSLLKEVKQISTEWTKNYIKNFSFVTTICNLFPIINSVKNYSFRTNILHDLFAGLTLSMILIPEAMANGYLSGMGAANGLYVAFFPGLINTLMGTSHHTSMGKQLNFEHFPHCPPITCDQNNTELTFN